MATTRHPGTHSVARSAARSTAGTASGAVVAAVAGFLFTVVVTRTLGPSGSGLVFSGVALSMVLIAVSTVGTETGVVWAFPRAIALGRAWEVKALVPRAFAVVAAFSAVLAAGLWLAAPQLGESIGDSGDEAAATIRVFAVGVLVGGTVVLLVQAVRALGTIWPFVLLQQVGLPTLRVGGVALIGVLGATHATSLAWAWVLPLFVVGLLAWRTMRRRINRLPTDGMEDPPSVRTMAEVVREFRAFSAKRFLASVGSQLLTWSDVVLVAVLASPSAAGVYAAASRFATTGRIALEATRLAVAPRVSRGFAVGELKEVSMLAQASALWAVALSWPLYLMLIVFAPTTLSVFGPEFTEGGDSLVLMSLGMLAAVGTGNIGMLLNMSGRSGLLAVNVWLAVAVNFGLNIWLVPTYGIEGAAVAWCGSLVVENALGLLQVLRMRVRTHSWDFVPVSALVTGVTLLVALVAERTVGQNWSGVLAAAGGLAVILPIVYFSMRGRLLLKERGADSYDSQSENGEV